MGRRAGTHFAQAWVELISEDPEAVSALSTARAHLSEGGGLKGLRRLRVFELEGRLPPRAALEELLHRSTQFYNPHKERCTLRLGADGRAPVGAGDQVVLVVERGGERRAAAERWWRHETGEPIEVREGVAWVMSFGPGAPVAERADALARVRDRRHGLFCNPHAQEYRRAGAEPPLRWLGMARRAARDRDPGGRS